MASYYVTMMIETADEDEEASAVEQALRDAATAQLWLVVSLTVVES
jgi:hypothetical protein